jgi:hypothetical protein
MMLRILAALFPRTMIRTVVTAFDNGYEIGTLESSDCAEDWRTAAGLREEWGLPTMSEYKAMRRG